MITPEKVANHHSLTLQDPKTWAYAPPNKDSSLGLCDKLSRLSTFATAGKLKVDNEGYHDAILDIINYCILFDGYVSSKKK